MHLVLLFSLLTILGLGLCYKSFTKKGLSLTKNIIITGPVAVGIGIICGILGLIGLAYLVFMFVTFISRS